MAINRNKPDQTLSQWFMNIRHKDFECLPDTLVKKVTKLVYQNVEKTNWLFTFIAFIAGALLGFIL